MRLLRLLLAFTLIGVCVYALPGAIALEHAQAGDKPRELRASKATYGTGMVKYGGLGPEKWRWRYVLEKRKTRQLARGLRAKKLELRRRYEQSSLTAIALASVTYGVNHSMLIRKASCETGGTFSPFAKNPTSSASGLFQFLTSTWATTPFGRFSIWDPYANALAAGWMHDVGRGGEWSCR